jgi:hypothetical protein
VKLSLVDHSTIIRAGRRAAPDDGAVGEDVADLQTLLEQRPIAAHNRGRGLRTQDAGQTGGHGSRDNGGLLQEAAAWIAAMFWHGGLLVVWEPPTLRHDH